MKTEVFLLLGSNKGDKKQYLKDAIDLINKQLGILLERSSLYRSAPWQMESKNYFLNQILKIETEFSPMELLEKSIEIEKELGRNKTAHGYEKELGKSKTAHGCQDREIDIDILFYGDTLFESENLLIPHPRLHLRKFTLLPFFELDPLKVHPLLKKNIKKLLDECEDNLEVEKVEF